MTMPMSSWAISAPSPMVLSAKGDYRLIVAGFVEARQTAPNTREFSYDSYLAHVEATRDPEFWGQRQPGHRFTNLERFQQAI